MSHADYVSEAEWLSSKDPAAMLGLHQVKFDSGLAIEFSPRKLRLFACACVRTVWHLLTDDAVCLSCDSSGEVCCCGAKMTSYHYQLTEGKCGPPEPCSNCSGTGRINRSRRAVEVAEEMIEGIDES